MDSPHSTYTHGPTFLPTRNITGQMLIDACAELGKLFNAKYATNKYEFSPEEITDGGIQWISWPGKTDQMYKTIRIYFSDYPMVHEFISDPTIVIDRRSDLPYALYDGDTKRSAWLGTFFNAFRGAPAWNSDDFEIFIGVLASMGMVLTPIKKDQRCRVRDANEVQVLKNHIVVHKINQKITGLQKEIYEIERSTEHLQS